MALRICIVELTILLPILLGLLIERVRPAEEKTDTAQFNLGYTVVMTILYTVLLEPIAGVEAAYLTSRFGQPPISLPNQGWWVAGSVLILLASKDFLDYWFHRAQHRFPLMWAMHSFHHSDNAMNVTTSQRHFWMDRVLLICVTYLPLGLVFQFGTKTAVMFSIAATFFSLFPHMNLKVEFGRFSWIALGPQLHRTHHSIHEEHYNANYAGVFPIWDVLFGTYKPPKARVFPKTGIDGSAPRGLWAALIWPMRRHS